MGRRVKTAGHLRCLSRTGNSVPLRSGAKPRFDPEKWQKERFAPLPAVLLAGLLTKLSRMKTLLFFLSVIDFYLFADVPLFKGISVWATACQDLTPMPHLPDLKNG